MRSVLLSNKTNIGSTEMKQPKARSLVNKGENIIKFNVERDYN